MVTEAPHLDTVVDTFQSIHCVSRCPLDEDGGRGVVIGEFSHSAVGHRLCGDITAETEPELVDEGGRLEGFFSIGVDLAWLNVSCPRALVDSRRKNTFNDFFTLSQEV